MPRPGRFDSYLLADYSGAADEGAQRRTRWTGDAMRLSVDLARILDLQHAPLAVQESARLEGWIAGTDHRALGETGSASTDERPGVVF